MTCFNHNVIPDYRGAFCGKNTKSIIGHIESSLLVIKFSIFILLCHHKNKVRYMFAVDQKQSGQMDFHSRFKLSSVKYSFKPF